MQEAWGPPPGNAHLGPFTSSTSPSPRHTLPGQEPEVLEGAVRGERGKEVWVGSGPSPPQRGCGHPWGRRAWRLPLQSSGGAWLSRALQALLSSCRCFGQRGTALTRPGSWAGTLRHQLRAAPGRVRVSASTFITGDGPALCVCKHVCVFTHVYESVCIYVNVYFVYVSVCTHEHGHVHTCACDCVPVCCPSMCVHVCTCVSGCMSVCMCVNCLVCAHVCEWVHVCCV